MKYKILKITGDELIWGKNNLEKQDLVDKATNRIDILLNVEEGTYFDSETNSWKEIPGE